MSRRFARQDQGWGYASGTATLTASATPHTKGDWADLIAGASIARDVSRLTFHLTADIGASNTATSTLLDIGLGGSGTSVDKTVVTNIPIGASVVNAQFWLPLCVPAGVRLAGRIQGTVISETAALQVVAWYGNSPPEFGGFVRGDALGINTATSAPTAGDLTDNAWEEVISSTTVDYRALQGIACGIPADNSWVDSTHSIDVGMGAGGAEQVIGTVVQRTTATELSQSMHNELIGKAIPSGTRLAMRKNTTNDGCGTIIGWR